MPLRSTSVPHGPDMQLYRKLSFGGLAEFMVLDTRQYRTNQPNGDGLRRLNDAANVARQHLAGRQAARSGSRNHSPPSPATWNVLAQQVMMGMVDAEAGGRASLLDGPMARLHPRTEGGWSSFCTTARSPIQLSSPATSTPIG